MGFYYKIKKMIEFKSIKFNGQVGDAKHAAIITVSTIVFVIIHWNTIRLINII